MFFWLVTWVCASFKLIPAFQSGSWPLYFLNCILNSSTFVLTQLFKSVASENLIPGISDLSKMLALIVFNSSTVEISRSCGQPLRILSFWGSVQVRGATKPFTLKIKRSFCALINLICSLIFALALTRLTKSPVFHFSFKPPKYSI